MRSYFFHCFFGTLGIIKTKFGQMLMQLINISNLFLMSNLFFVLNSENWKLVSGPFMTSINWKYEILEYSVNVYPFEMPQFTL